MIHAFIATSLLAVSAAQAQTAPSTQPDAKPAPQVTAESTAEEVRAAWEALYVEDQRYRSELVRLMNEEGKTFNDPEVQQTAGQMNRADQENWKTWQRLIDLHGWPRQSEYGQQAASAAFLVLQHADVDKQQQHLPLVLAMVELGELRPQSYALLLDRILMRNGHPQVFGSQARTEGNRTVFAEIYDIEKVDERRAARGLEPLSDYAKRLNAELPEDYTPPSSDGE